MEGSNGLISEFRLFLDVGKGFRGIEVRRGGAGRKGELCSYFFLAESDGFRLVKVNFSTKTSYTIPTLDNLVFSCLELGWCQPPSLLLLLCPMI